MSRKTNTAIALFTVRADEIALGDVIRHSTGDIWQIISEPEYGDLGISLEVLDAAVPDDAQNAYFIYAQPHQRFELVSYQFSQSPVTEVRETETPSFIHSHTHRGRLIGILRDGADFSFHVYEPGSLFEETCIILRSRIGAQRGD